MDYRFSIVIPVLNLRHSIETLLRCLEGQEFPKDRFECLIVDDMSTDGTTEFLASYNSPLNLKALFNRTNKGRAQARNIGWMQARGEIVLFLDGDMLPEPAWLRDYDEAIARHEDWDVVSGGRYCLSVPREGDLRRNLAQLINADPETLLANDLSTDFEALAAMATLGQYPSWLSNQLERQLRDVCQLYPESLICGYSLVTSNVAIRREKLREVGGFDSFLRRAEDTDLGLRLWGIGCRFGFADGARAYHLYDPGQPDRHMTHAENLAFFYRHPYTLVMAIHLWCLINATEGMKATAQPADLAQLARLSRGSLPPDLARQVASLAARFNLDSHSYPKEFLVDYFAEISGSSPVEIEGYLDLAVRRGVFTSERDGKTHFDIYHTSNWLRYHSRYEEHCLRHSSYGRTTRTRYQITGCEQDIARVAYSGTYEVHIPTSMLNQHCEGALNLALPIQDEYQTGVSIVDCFPDDLLQYADYSKSMILGFPLKNCRRLDGKIGYVFQCEVREAATGRNRPVSDQNDAYSSYLQPTLNPDYLAMAKALLLRIEPDLESDPERVAEVIYLWILDNTSFYETPLPDFFCLETGIGACAHQVGLFVNLCRLANIPARERYGGILSKADGREPRLIETRTRGVSPFSHIWAEFHSPKRGWVPVDFIGWGYGRRLMTAHNVTDQDLRAELDRDTTLYDSYYFGHLDPFRVYAGEAVRKTLLYSFELGNGKKAPATFRQQLMARTSHLLRCRITSQTNLLEMGGCDELKNPTRR